MKTLIRKLSYRFRPAMMSVAFVITAALAYAGGLPSSDPSVVVITKNLNSKKHKIRLFTASDSRTLLFTVDGVSAKHYTLFVFDLDGKLVTQSAILSHESSILPAISAGAYLYEVFVEDQKVESGQMIVK